MILNKNVVLKYTLCADLHFRLSVKARLSLYSMPELKKSERYCFSAVALFVVYGCFVGCVLCSALHCRRNFTWNGTWYGKQPSAEKDKPCITESGAFVDTAPLF